MLRTLLIGISLLSCSASYGQVPNAGFENWATDDNGKTYPEGWNTSPKDSITQTSDAYEGSSAARIKPFQGIEITPSILETGFQYGINSPEHFTAYVKTQIPGNDTVSIQANLYNNGNLTASEKWTTSETISTYQEITLDFDDVNNDSAFISFQSGCCEETGGADPETTLIVDELAFDVMVGIQDSKKTEQVEIFPNPVSEAFQIKGLKPSNAYQYQLYNTLGQLAKSGNFQSQKPRISLEGLSKGVYQLFLTNENSGATTSTKVVKQ